MTHTAAMLGCMSYLKEFLKFYLLGALASSLNAAKCLALAFWAVGFADFSRFPAKSLRRIVDVPKREFASSLAQLREIDAFAFFSVFALRADGGFGRIAHRIL